MLFVHFYPFADEVTLEEVVIEVYEVKDIIFSKGPIFATVYILASSQTIGLWVDSDFGCGYFG